MSDKKEFDVESLDPDKRSWYYDGDGTKRPKEENDEKKDALVRKDLPAGSSKFK